MIRCSHYKVLILSSLFVFGCSTVQLVSETSIQKKYGVRSPASDIYFTPRNIKDSPYKDIKIVDYKQLKSSLNQYILSRPSWVPFQSQEQRWAWASKQAQINPNFFKILAHQSDTSDAALLQKLKEKHPEITRKYAWVTRLPWYKNRKPSRLFAYEIFYKSTKEKPTVLIWAKEHGDELSTAEFATELSKFFLFHLENKGNPSLNLVVQRLFSKINVMVVPDMTPDKNFETFKNKSSTIEDFNGFRQLLQPFNYDSENSDDYVAAPEAAYLKKIILDNENLALGIDIHDPFGVSVIAGPDDSVAENNRFLIAESTNISQCILNLSNFRDNPECSTGQFRVAHPQISAGTANAPSFFSRTHLAPSILLELDTAKPDDVPYSGECDYGHKEITCQAYIRSILRQGLPYFIRLLEITGSTYQLKSSKTKTIQYEFADKFNSKSLLVKSDTFIDNLSEIDIRLRFEGRREMSREQFVDFIGSQSLDWGQAEKERIKRIMVWLDSRIDKLQLKFKLPMVTFIKTTGKEEGGFPYTRGNSIILGADYISSQDLLATISHEIFHIWFRNNLERRTELYRIFGYKILRPGSGNACPAGKYRISNPDLETQDVGINLEHRGMKYTGIPLVFNKEGAKVSPESSLFRNFAFHFCLISSETMEKGIVAEVKDTNYDKLVGTNTTQTFHPDELLAESFSLLLTHDTKLLPNPEFIKMLYKALQ